MQDRLEPFAGGVALMITLSDEFFTVLYVRAGTGLLVPPLAGACGACSVGCPAEGSLVLRSSLVIHLALGTGPVTTLTLT